MVQEKNIVRLGLTIIMFIALLGLVSTPALAHGRYNKRACSKTASSAYLACQYEVKDDYWIAKGNCYNLSDKEERAECFEEAKDEYKETKRECRDQLEARKDLCEELGEAPYDPEIDPENFVDPEDIGDGVDPNPYFPLVPGYMWTYKAREDGVVTETITVEVLAGETIEIDGVECAVVRDIVYDGDSTDPEDIIEDTFDWYGQKIDGTVLYMGEFSLSKEECDPEELCEGLYTEDGSWKSGYEGGKAGIIMFADPSDELGTVFRQEFSLGNAEDVGEVVSVTESQTVPAASASCTGDCLQTKDFTPIEPDVFEYKYYSPGVGMIKEVGFEDGEETGEVVELISGP